MKCVMCGARMTESRGDYEYESLPGITLVGVDVYRCPECDEEEVSIPRIEELHHTIAKQLVRKADGAGMAFKATRTGWKPTAA